MLKIAIVGLGVISHTHISCIRLSNKAKLVAVCDINPQKCEPFKDVPFFLNLDEMLASIDIDCVHICLPHFLHTEAIIKCAKAGVHVFTEKPLGISYKDCSTTFALEDEYSIKIGVCLQNRYNATTCKLKEISKSEELGDFLGSKGIVTWSRTMDYYKASPWRGKLVEAGSGVMLNQSIHTLDLLAYLGGDFSSLNAKMTNFSLKELEIEDSVMARLTYESSNLPSIYFATIGYSTNSSVEIEMVFEHATFKIVDSKLYRYDDAGEVHFICEDEKMPGSKHYYGASHLVAIEAFYDAILNNTSNYISVQDASYSIKLIDAIKKSSENDTTISL